MERRMDNVVIENGHGRAVISPGAGAALRSLRVRTGGQEHELLYGGDGELAPESCHTARAHSSWPRGRTASATADLWRRTASTCCP